MQKLIKNDWCHEPGEAFIRSRILNHKKHPEGLNVDRIRFLNSGRLVLKSGLGHIISVLRGIGKLYLKDGARTLNLEAGVHLYIPSDLISTIEAEPGTELLRVSSSSAFQAIGNKLLLRNEIFLAAAASRSQSLRWILTPQYLSRRIFLYHDQTLLSKSRNPVSWFHTSMFDVAGLPENEEGEPVFKMSYNSRTEVNFCYDVKGNARVRMAKHPYSGKKQIWESWLSLDGESTYHLNELAGSFRNKHEVYIHNGYVSLFCMFDPAPTGMERHRPGEYSDYEPISLVLGTKPYENYTKEIAKYDEMVDQLSMAKAKNDLQAFEGTRIWDLYLQGKEAQANIENELLKKTARENKGRAKVVSPWMQPLLERVK